MTGAGSGAGGSGGGNGVPEFNFPGGGVDGGANAGSGGGSGLGQPPTVDNNCGVKKVDLQARPADLLLVLDRSRSMLQNVAGEGGLRGGGQQGSKWSEVVAAIDPVVMKTQTQVAWGLKLFPAAEQCGVPDGASVPVAPSNYAAVMSAIRANDPGLGQAGSTPTRIAVEKATTFMKGNASPNAKYLVVATDGLPNCGSGGGVGTGRGSDGPGAVAAIAAAAAAGIPSFVVGIATAGTDAHNTLNEMALKGGRPRNDVTKYYPVMSRDELVKALEAIAGQVASCTFPLDPAPPEPENVAVEVDGKRVPRDPGQASGWNYGPGNRSVVIFGAVCDGLKAGMGKNVKILYGCPGAVVL